MVEQNFNTNLQSFKNIFKRDHNPNLNKREYLDPMAYKKANDAKRSFLRAAIRKHELSANQAAVLERIIYSTDPLTWEGQIYIGHIRELDCRQIGYSTVVRCVAHLKKIGLLTVTVPKRSFVARNKKAPNIFKVNKNSHVSTEGSTEIKLNTSANYFANVNDVSYSKILNTNTYIHTYINNYTVQIAKDDVCKFVDTNPRVSEKGTLIAQPYIELQDELTSEQQNALIAVGSGDNDQKHESAQQTPKLDTLKRNRKHIDASKLSDLDLPTAKEEFLRCARLRGFSDDEAERAFRELKAAKYSDVAKFTNYMFNAMQEGQWNYVANKPKRENKGPCTNGVPDSYIDSHARPGETRRDAATRLREKYFEEHVDEPHFASTHDSASNVTVSVSDDRIRDYETYVDTPDEYIESGHMLTYRTFYNNLPTTGDLIPERTEADVQHASSVLANLRRKLNS